MYVHGLNQFADYQNQVEPEPVMSWLDYLIISNPQGVMKVLADYGYTGYLAPADQDEMFEACQDLIDKYGDQITAELLKNHPLFDVIAEIQSGGNSISTKDSFKNASGASGVIQTINTENLKILAGNALVIIGAFFIAQKLLEYLTKKE